MEYLEIFGKNGINKNPEIWVFIAFLSHFFQKNSNILKKKI